MAQSSRFIIDKITESIEEKATNTSFETDVISITPNEIKRVYKKDGWFFNWKKEFRENPNHSIYKLVIADNNVIQGLISLEPIPGQLYIEMHLIENAPHNYGENKQYLGVSGNMVAFACRMSFDLGYEGYVAFNAKTYLVDHYIETLGAQVIYSNDRMGIFTPSAKKFSKFVLQKLFQWLIKNDTINWMMWVLLASRKKNLLLQNLIMQEKQVKFSARQDQLHQPNSQENIQELK